MNINIGKLIKKYKIILYLVIIIGSLLLFKHIFKKNTIENYSNSNFEADRGDNSNLVWAGYQICASQDKKSNVVTKKLDEICEVDKHNTYPFQQNVHYGWKDKTKLPFKKIKWEKNKIDIPELVNMEKFKASITKQAKKSWISIIHDDQWKVNSGTNKLKNLEDEWTRMTNLWSIDPVDRGGENKYAYHQKCWNTHPKQPRNMSPYELLNKFISGEINENSNIMRKAHYETKLDGTEGKVKNNRDDYYPLKYFQHGFTESQGLYPWLKTKLNEKRNIEESKYFWYKNGDEKWKGPYDKYQLLKKYQSGDFHDSSLIIRSTSNNKTLNKIDKANTIKFHQLGENLAYDNNNNRKHYGEEIWNPSGISEKNGDTKTYYDLYGWIQKNASSKEDGSWPYHRKPKDTNLGQTDYKTITNLKHPLFGSVVDITKSECITEESRDLYGKPIANYGKCNKKVYPFGNTCYYKNSFWGFQDKGICYPLKCIGEYDPNKKCRTKYKNSDIPKCLQENGQPNCVGPHVKTKITDLFITGNNNLFYDFEKKFTVNGKKTNIDKPYHNKKTKCSCVCQPGWSGDSCDIPVSWENRCAGATDVASCKKNTPELENVQDKQANLLELVLITSGIIAIVTFFLFIIFYNKDKPFKIDGAFRQLHTNYKNIKANIPINNPRLDKAFGRIPKK